MKKNNRPIYSNRRTGKPIIGKSAKLKDAEEIATATCRYAGIDTIEHDVNCAFKIYTRTNRRIDLSNAVQLYEDALEASGVLVNDNQIRSLDGTRQYKDSENPRVEIVITDFLE